MQEIVVFSLVGLGFWVLGRSFLAQFATKAEGCGGCKGCNSEAVFQIEEAGGKTV
jgi:hypothetical protein